MENIALAGLEILGIHRITGEIIFLVPDVLIIEIICGVVIIFIGHGGVLCMGRVTSLQNSSSNRPKTAPV